jgi:hypothetical protein
VRAFALIEDWLRASDPIDPARRLLPFVDAWPRRLVDLLGAEGGGWSLGDLSDAYVMLSPTRNRALDLLPLLEHLDPERVRRALPEGQAKGGRPTWHYRLPEARVDEPDWTSPMNGTAGASSNASLHDPTCWKHWPAAGRITVQH